MNTAIPSQPSAIGGVAAVLYGSVAYVTFLVTISYAIGFVGDLWVPKTIDTGATATLIVAVNVDIALLALFAVQHSVMARPQFKRWWTRFVPSSVERSTYVLLASVALLLVFLMWQPIPGVVWDLAGSPLAMVLEVAFWLGWAIVLSSTFLIDHFELFGLRQVYARLTRQTLPGASFRTPLLYRLVRHPLYFGFLVAFWSAPTMTEGRLLFAAVTTGYILLAIRLEERDLIDSFGEQYRRYRMRVRMLLPLPMLAKAKAQPRQGSRVRPA